MKANLFRLLRLHWLSNHFPALHGVRVLAILAVLQFHVTVILVKVGLLTDAHFAQRSTTIFFGMDLFFILSGFLIGTMLLHGEQISGRSLLRFYARRSFRIFPLYYITLTTLALLNPLTAAQKHNLIYEYLYLTNYRLVVPESVVMIWGWSLAVEEHFYLAVPFLVGLLLLIRGNRWRLLLLTCLWASGLFVRLYVLYFTRRFWQEDTIFQAVYVKTHTRYDILIAGIWLAYVQRHYATSLQHMFRKWWVRWILWCVAGMFLYFLMSPLMFRNYFMYRMLSWGTYTSLMYVPVILLLLNARGWVQSTLGHRFFLAMATLGYGIYLVHIPLCDWVIVPMARWMIQQHHWSLGPAWTICLLSLFVVSAAVAYVMHIAFEKPLLYLRDRWVP
jgi:peptidoglycan/LPS O-acetylase OafA/YrhL